jgi:hypothetical protein
MASKATSKNDFSILLSKNMKGGDFNDGLLQDQQKRRDAEKETRKKEIAKFSNRRVRGKTVRPPNRYAVSHM